MSNQESAWSVELAGQTFYLSGRRYPTELASAKAWEAVDRQRYQGAYLSAFRLLDQESKQMVVVVVGEDPKPIRRAARLIAKGGELWRPDQEITEKLILRRARVTVEGASRPGQEVLQRARYGKNGALLNNKGQLRPRRRPQG